ncbi:MAG: hypothetical protein L0Y54_23495, partial [Sporichthyaceae bacterium]|nr:hypothetical protein [Sporichthyaceae bacterium]
MIGCQQGPDKEIQQKLDQLSSVSAEKDQLLSEVAENSRLINDINTELHTVWRLDTTVPADSGVSPALVARLALLAKLRQVTGRLQQSEERLAAGRSRLRALSQGSDSLKIRIAELE